MLQRLQVSAARCSGRPTGGTRPSKGNPQYVHTGCVLASGRMTSMSSRHYSHSQAPRLWQATQRGGKSRSTAIFPNSFSHARLDGAGNPLWIIPVTLYLSCGKNGGFHVDTSLGDDIPQNRRKHSFCVSPYCNRILPGSQLSHDRQEQTWWLARIRAEPHTRGALPRSRLVLGSAHTC